MVVETLTADEAAGRVQATDTLGMPLGPGQPPSFIEALGRRTDWEDLRLYGALLTVLSELFSHPNVHYLSEGLYAWLDGNDDVAFLPVDLVNSPDVIGRNRVAVTINAALALDIQGQVVADTISANQYSGIGGHEDFVSGPALSLEARSLLCLPATYMAGDELRSRVVPWFEAGTVITTPRHQVDVVVTENGAAELQGLTVHQRGEALAAIAHPAFRAELREAAERASRGRSPMP